MNSVVAIPSTDAIFRPHREYWNGVMLGLVTKRISGDEMWVIRRYGVYYSLCTAIGSRFNLVFDQLVLLTQYVLIIANCNKWHILNYSKIRFHQIQIVSFTHSSD